MSTTAMNDAVCIPDEASRTRLEIYGSAGFTRADLLRGIG